MGDNTLNIPYPYKYILLIRSITPLHVGSGRGTSPYVDVPIQRDEYGFPTIWASSIKGSIKSWTKGVFKSEETWKDLFGPEPHEALAHTQSSGLAILDARLFMIPVRVLSGIWAYATSPHLLRMANEYLSMIGFKLNLNNIDSGKISAIVSKEELVMNNKIMVNEAELEAIHKPDLLASLNLDKLLGVTSEIYKLVKEHGLIVLPDINDVSLSIINRSIVIQYRIRLDRLTKTVEKGALWSEEYVPSNTLFVSSMLVKRIGSSEVDSLIGILSRRLSTGIYIGGRETIGKGLIKIHILASKDIR